MRINELFDYECDGRTVSIEVDATPSDPDSVTLVDVHSVRDADDAEIDLGDDELAGIAADIEAALDIESEAGEWRGVIREAMASDADDALDAAADFGGAHPWAPSVHSAPRGYSVH